MNGRPLLKRILRRLAQAALLGLGILLAVLLWNLWHFRSRQLSVAATAEVPLPEQALVDRLAAAVAIPTVSQQTRARTDAAPFDRFAEFLEESFPSVHKHLDRLTGDDFGNADNRSLLLRWQGSDAAQPAILLMAHYDVVPVPADTLAHWTHPPFAGVVDDRYVWGRGTLDVKDAAMAIMEAIDYLLQKGFRPQRTVYVALGHDEEVGGADGNAQIAQWMRRQGIRLLYVLDEGGCIYTDFPGLDAPVALVGVAEKGWLSVRLTVQLNDGGHASMPPPQTAIGVLARAISRIEQNPLPARLDGGADMMLDYVGPEMPMPRRLAVANRWLFAPLIKRSLTATPSGNAALRTTIAATIIQGGVKENVLPTQAEATLNVRVLPGDHSQRVLAHLKRTVADQRVAIEPLAGGRQPSRISSTQSPAFHTLHTTIKQIFPDVVVAPFVVIGGTDAAHFDDLTLSKDVYRFIPAPMDDADLKRIHGIDERIARKDYLNIVRFYIRLLEASATPEG